MDESIRRQLTPGTQVTVIQQVPHRDRVWTTSVSGTIVRFEQQPTGSWFAHAKDKRLWLDRLVLRKPDGELTTLSLDQYSRVEVAGKS